MRIFAVLFCGMLAACSQTNSQQETVAQAAPTKATTNTAASARRCEEAVAKAQQQATSSAMLGSALSMAGGLGGFAGRGGAIAAQAVSMGGSVMQAKSRNDARAAVEQECL